MGSKKWLAVILAGLMVSGSAFAGPINQGGRGSGGGGKDSGVRASRGDSHGGSNYRGSSSRGSSRGNNGRANGFTTGSNTPILDALRNGSNNGNLGYGNGQVLRELGRAYERERDRREWEEREDDYRDAQRTEMIVSGVVGLVGALANANRPQYIVQSPPPVCVTPVPVCPPPPPRGHYVTERVVVREGYHESHRVWVPDYRDPATGHIVVGHYETHQTWVPPVIEERQVWVQH